MKGFSLFLVFIFLGILITSAQTSTEKAHTFGFKASGYLANEELPFWTFTNTFGALSEDSDGVLYAFAKANYRLSEHATLELKTAGLFRNGINPSLQRAELYANFSNNWIEITLGSQNFTSSYELSSVRRNILFSSNARALPGLLVQNSKPIKLTKRLSLDGALAHYALNDDRFVDNTRVHYKNLYINWSINDSNTINVGVQHVAQWGGVSPDAGSQPNGLRDLAKIFFGRGGADNANFGDQINALGNHIGSYSLTYLKKGNGVLDFDVYYQTLFEDRSGIELNNFPDGVWGISIKNKKSKLVKEFLYEYVQTVSQSGRPRLTQNGGQQSGGDNYFLNSIYRSGWTYEGRTIGLPFINIVANSEGVDPGTNNRSIAHHLGVRGNLHQIDYAIKLTYLENLGTFAIPRLPRNKFLYSYFRAMWATKSLGTFSMEIGADWSNVSSTTFGAGIGYNYTIKL